MFYMIVHEVDEARVWGCICSCRQAELLGGKNITCKMKSRRLHGAGRHIQDLVKPMLRKANMLSLVESNGDEQVLSDASSVLRKAAGLLAQKFELLGMIPWLFARADEPNQASVCLKQWDATPEQKHHRVSIAIMHDFKHDITEVAAGRPPSPELQVKQVSKYVSKCSKQACSKQVGRYAVSKYASMQ